MIKVDEDQTKICPHCKKDIPLPAVKCMYCAQWIDKKEPFFYSDESVKICPDCRTENPEYAKYCGNCRREFDLKEPVYDNNLIEESFVNLCPYCDSEVHYKAVKCKYCGEWIVKKKDLKEFTDPAKNAAITEIVREAVLQLKNYLR